MDIYSYLKNDHLQVSALMDTLVSAQTPRQRTALFHRIRDELTLHADTEEVTFYKAIDDATQSKRAEERLEHADKEHEEIRQYLVRLSTMPVENPKWMELFGELRHAVTHHVQEEESDVFESAKKCLSREQAVMLARQMDALKERYKKKLSAA